MSHNVSKKHEYELSINNRQLKYLWKNLNSNPPARLNTLESIRPTTAVASLHFVKFRPIQHTLIVVVVGDPPQALLSHTSLLPFLPPSSLRLGVTSQRVREWEQTGKKAHWNNIANSTSHTSCLRALCRFLLKVCSSLTNQALARVPVSFTASYIQCH